MKSQLLSLLKEHSFKRGEYILTSGKKSHYIIDCKQTLLLASGHFLAARLILEIIESFSKANKIKVDAIAGVELGGCSIASAVSTMSLSDWFYRTGELDALYVRKTVKTHGSKNLIEGNVKSGSNLILLEDVITTGASSVFAINVLKDAGYNVIAVIAIVDRVEGGCQALQEKFNIPVVTIFTIKDFE